MYPVRIAGDNPTQGGLSPLVVFASIFGFWCCFLRGVKRCGATHNLLKIFNKSLLHIYPLGHIWSKDVVQHLEQRCGASLSH